MKRLLIVSPHFPPVNAPDLHRVRLSLPYYREFGWEVTVLACEPDPVTAQAMEPLLAEALPSSTEIRRVRAAPALPGLRNLAWRSWRALARAGDDLLTSRTFDLVFFSTTQFTTFTLGPRWLKRFGVPFVCDLQDPWVNTYYDRHPEMPRPGGWKHHVAQSLARILERRTLPRAAGLIAVSEAYPREIDARLPAMHATPRIILPFGADERDWTTADSPAATQTVFAADAARFHLVSVGRGGVDLQPAVVALARILSGVNASAPATGVSLRQPHLHLIGTSYAANDQASPQFSLSADAATTVSEHPRRLGFYTALRCLRDADAVVVLGSRDPGYQPSKLHIAASSGRPVVAVVWPDSGLARALRSQPVDLTIVLNGDGNLSEAERIRSESWLRVQCLHPRESAPAPRPIPASYHARNLTAEQVGFFVRVSG